MNKQTSSIEILISSCGDFEMSDDERSKYQDILNESGFVLDGDSEPADFYVRAPRDGEAEGTYVDGQIMGYSVTDDELDAVVNAAFEQIWS